MTLKSRSVLKIYRSLDREQIQLVIDKKFEGRYPMDQWLKKLHKLAVMDTLGDDTRQNSASLLIVFGIFTVFTLILTISKPFLFFFPIGFFLLFFYFLIMYITLNKIDIGNHLRLFIVPLLEKLNTTGTVNDPLYLKMDFANPINKNNLSRDADGKRIYKHHWMHGEITFTDQVNITWEIEDIVKEVERSLQDKAKRLDLLKKNAITHQLTMHFTLAKDLFEIHEQEPSITDTGDYFKIKLSRKDTSKSIDEGMVPSVFLDTIKEGYRKFKKKKELSP